ncbi:hypothetical protein Ate02nite_50820 [Paractinoplanes tereljensis]|uniref:Uncharacterized protein n=1 Tax=Paractinoplanes tereljensis TaxID=571912 RepID=A0A919NR88_9ACTN|nr:hypothetical protein [Actinoplanes tereljensis]GIF22352.1 hypothetical protein Ate02nite_50820 [Actinoplanes tereljensis]
MAEVSLGAGQVAVALEQDPEVVMGVRVADLCAGAQGRVEALVPSPAGQYRRGQLVARRIGAFECFAGSDIRLSRWRSRRWLRGR